MRVWAVSLSTTELSPRRLTHARCVVVFAVCMGLVTSTWPRAHTALYHHNTCGVAVPQYISGRTSYLHVRLEFLPYPQLIPQFCNTGECEPRRSFTFASLWPWIAHVVSGRIGATRVRLLQTRLPCGSPTIAGGLTWQRRCTRRIILQKARHQPLVGRSHSGL